MASTIFEATSPRAVRNYDKDIPDFFFKEQIPKANSLVSSRNLLEIRIIFFLKFLLFFYLA